MKKFLLTIVSLIIMMGLSGCSYNKIDTMVIQESKLLKETQEILDMIDTEMVFFDYKVDKTIQSMTMDIWVYKNGEWVNSGGTEGNIDTPKQRIALRLNGNSYNIFNIDESGYTQYNFENVVDFSKSNALAFSSLTHPTPIEPHKEIVLWVKLSNDQNSIATHITEDFRKADCDAGIAVTITFSDKSID